MAKLNLRDYQTEAIKGVVDQPGIHKWLYQEGHFSGLVVLPTGSGKTFTLVAYIEALRLKRRKAGEDLGVIWLAHRDELIEQAADTFHKVNPNAFMTSWTAKKVLLESGNRLPGPKDANGEIIFGMINSTKALFDSLEIVAKSKNRRYLVVIDEAHHYALPKHGEPKYSNMYMRFMKKATALTLGCGRSVIDKLVGLTATPSRLDERPLGFDGIAYRISFLELVRRGHLAKPVYREMRTNIEAKLDARGGEFTVQSLERLNTPSRNLAIAKEIFDHRWRYGKTLVFCCSRKHCQDLAKAMHEHAASIGIQDIPVKIIDGMNSRLERQEIKVWLDQGSPREFKVLINCMVYTEGFDAPTLNSVVLARPTMSEALWMQMVGRGARVVKKRASFPASRFKEHPPVGEMGLFRSAADPARTAVGKTIALHPGTNPQIVVEQSVKDKFNLTVVSDDITRFATLIKEWELLVLPEEADKAKQKRQRKQQKGKVKKVLRNKKIIQKVEGDLDEAQLVNVQGILVVSTLHHDRIGIPMDDDRMDCVRGLHQFAKGCWIDVVDHSASCNKPVDPRTGDPSCQCKRRKIFDMDLFAQSFTYCVAAGALPSAVWTKIMWAYYFHEIRNQHTLVHKKSGKVVPTWQFVPVKTITEEMVQKSRLRVSKDVAQARIDNARFNTEYGGRKKILELFQTVFRRALRFDSKVASVGALNHVHRRIKGISAVDRRIVVHTDIILKEESDPWIHRMFVFREALTKAIQDELNDSCCMVQAVAQNSRLNQKDAHAFKPTRISGASSGLTLVPDTQI